MSSIRKIFHSFIFSKIKEFMCICKSKFEQIIIVLSRAQKMDVYLPMMNKQRNNTSDYTCQEIENQPMRNKLVSKEFVKQQICFHVAKLRRQVKKKVFTEQSYNMQEISSSAEYQLILKNMAQKDVAYIYQNVSNIQKLTEQVFKKFVATNQHEDLLESFLNVFRYKIQNVSYSRSLFPTLFLCASKVRAHVENSRNNKKLNSQKTTGCFKVITKECQTDLVLKHFIQFCQTKNNRSGEYYIRDKSDARIPLKDYVAKVPEFDHIYWPQIFKIVQQVILKDNDDRKAQDMLKKEYLNNLHLEETPNLECLGCTKFFFQGYNIIIPTNKTKLVVMGSVRSLQANSKILKEEVCGLINNRGGYIMFGVQRDFFNVIAKGDTILEDEKKKIQQQIRKCCQEITPLCLDQIIISFVPVKENPYKNKGILKIDQNKNKYIERNLIEGRYVVRISIIPKDGNTAYFWMRDDKPTFTIRNQSINNHPKSKSHFSGTNYSQFIKLKFKKFNSQLKDNFNSRRNSMFKFSDIAHQCDKPLQGRPLNQQKQQQSSENPETAYIYASVLVVKHVHHSSILQNFRSCGVDGKISVRFMNYKLKGLTGTAIFYHNMRFQEIQSIVSNNKNFQFDGRIITILPITDYIRMADRSARNVMSRNDFESLGVWLKKQFKQCPLKMWKFTNDDNDTEFYIETGNRAAQLFIFLVMTSFNEKSQFRMPKGLQKMDQKEKASRMKLQYSLQ